MIEFKRNKNTGIVEAYRDGKKIDKVVTMGDTVKDSDETRKNKDENKK